MRCNFCEWRCDLSDGKYGLCRMYEEHEGEIRERFPNLWCTPSVSRIESLPFYHVYPGSRSMCIGTMSCNFKCRYCSNSYIAREAPEKVEEQTFAYLPEEMVGMARKLGCHNIVFNVNEPTVSLPSLLKLGEAVKGSGFSMGCLTNAYGTEETTECLADLFSFFNISLKGFSEAFHREYIGIKSPDPIFRNIRRLAETCHVEITTPVIQDANDHELGEIAAFLEDTDPQIPWHVFRLLPEHDMKQEVYPRIEKIVDILGSLRERLPYVYFHNFVGSDWVNTLCPQCGTEVIGRFSLGCGGDRLARFLCEGDRCHMCGQEIRLLGGWVPWSLEEVAE